MPKPLITLKQGGHRIDLFQDPSLPTGEGYVAHDNGKPSIVATLAANAARAFITATLQELLIPGQHLNAVYNSSGLLSFGPRVAELADYSNDVEVDNSHPKLAGYSPMGIGVFGPKESKLKVLKIESREPDRVFNRWQEKVVTYQIELPDGTKSEKAAEFSREQSENLETLEKLQAYLERQLGTPVLEAASKIEGSKNHFRTKFPEIEPLQMRNAYWRLVDYIRDIAKFETDLKPLGEVGRGLRFLLAYHAVETYLLGATVREAQLVLTQEASARKAAQSARGADKGGENNGKINTAHAKLWQSKFGDWLQTYIYTRGENARITQDDLVTYSKNNWPEKGFQGHPQRLPQCTPLKTRTLIEVISRLEREQRVVRPGAKKGRRPQSK